MDPTLAQQAQEWVLCNFDAICMIHLGIMMCARVYVYIYMHIHHGLFVCMKLGIYDKMGSQGLLEVAEEYLAIFT